eukprot:gene3916-4889_t
MCDCPLIDANTAWNEGFDEEYTRNYMNYTFTLDNMVARLAMENYQTKSSVVAYCKISNRPIGMIASGIRKLRSGVVVSWNGGTAVVPEFRKKGVGRKLMMAQFDLYKEGNVEIATIEVVLQNEKAYNLYKSVGFIQSDCFLNMEYTGEIPIDAFCTANGGESTLFRARSCSPQDVGKVEFYPKFVQWQAQWESYVLGGESLLIEDDNGQVVGYCLYKKRYDADLNLSGISLRHCQAIPDHPQYDQIINCILSYVFKPGYNCFRNLYLPPIFPELNQKIFNILSELGFKKFCDILCLQKDL